MPFKNKSVNGFTLQHLIGEGGMAEVWYAENKIKKPAAIKILKDEFIKMPEVVERFENEALAMVPLDHPNIRQVYDYELIEDKPCIIMQYLEGADLKHVLLSGKTINSGEIVQWWNESVDALNYTHAKGVVHRDIKPSNIFLTSEGRIRLLDFGIAKIRDSISKTRTFSKMGTLMYMSPEQVRDSKNLDYRTDVYSLAVTFHHLMAGKAPYDTNTDSDFDIQLKIVKEALDFNGIPANWHHFLLQFLDKDLTKRKPLIHFVSDEATIIIPKPDSPLKQQTAETKTQLLLDVVPPLQSENIEEISNFLALHSDCKEAGELRARMDELKWNNVDKNSLEEIQKYLKINGRSSTYGPEASLLEARLIENQIRSEFVKVLGTNSKREIRGFIERFPDSIVNNEALDAIQEIDWNEALEANTIELLQKYMSEYSSKGKYYNEAKKRIEDLRDIEMVEIFNHAMAGESIEALKKFKSDYPKSRYHEKVSQRIEQLIFENAKKKKTTKALESFLEVYPNSVYKAEAKYEILVLLEKEEDNDWENARKLAVVSAYEAYLKSYPTGKYVSAAKKAIEEPSWKQALSLNTVESFEKFLKSFPNGVFEKEAASHIQELREKRRQNDENEWDRIKQKPEIDSLKKYLAHFPYPIHQADANASLKLLLTRRNKKRWRTVAIVATLFFVILIIIAQIPTEEDSWKEAKQKGTFQSYKSFLTKYPDSKHKNETLDLMLSAAISKSDTSQLRTLISDYGENIVSQKAAKELSSIGHKATNGYTNDARALYIEAQSEINNADQTKTYDYARAIDILLDAAEKINRVESNIYATSSEKNEANSLQSEIDAFVQNKKDRLEQSMSNTPDANGKRLYEKRISELRRYLQNKPF